MSHQAEYERCRALVEGRLAAAFPGDGLEAAMAYSLLAGGKRVRPVLAIQFCQAAGGSLEQALDPACGLEMLHTYSLIHDDLPCMDDDDLRRGKPTCHRAFGECTATLAGDALQAAAFEWVLSTGDARLGVELARAAGKDGMCLGQFYDMDGETRALTLEELTNVHRKKTAALLRSACRIGVLCAGQGTVREKRLLEAADAYAEHLGLAFQIRDDLLDVTADPSALGKPVGSDATNGKCTFATLLGQAECERQIAEHTELARKSLEIFGETGAFLDWFALELAKRTH